MRTHEFPSFPTEQAQQVGRAVHLGHGRVQVLTQDLGVLRPLELVQQLSAQHHVEVLSDARHHFINCILPEDEERDASRNSPAEKYLLLPERPR